jgi:hypothetical protein
MLDEILKLLPGRVPEPCGGNCVFISTLPKGHFSKIERGKIALSGDVDPAVRSISQ